MDKVAFLRLNKNFQMSQLVNDKQRKFLMKKRKDKNMIQMINERHCGACGRKFDSPGALFQHIKECDYVQAMIKEMNKPEATS